jgi:transcriptional regulator with XRE-family HTH domain
MNRFGQKVRELRQGKGLSLRGLAPLVGVGYAYLSKVETGRLDFGDYPSEALIHKLADVLEGDEDELLLLAQKVPERIKQRVLERPDAFGRLASVDDASLDRLLKTLDDEHRPRRGRHRSKEPT